MWHWSCILLGCRCAFQEKYVSIFHSMIVFLIFHDSEQLAPVCSSAGSHYSPRNSLPGMLEMEKLLNLYLTYSIYLNKYFSTPCPPYKVIRTIQLPNPISQGLRPRINVPYFWNKNLNSCSALHLIFFYSHLPNLQFSMPEWSII